MNSTRYSKGLVVLLCVAGLLAAAGTASAFSVSAEDVPDESAVGEEVSVTYTIDDPFTDAPREWTLQGDTQLEDVSWTVTVLRAGSPISDGERIYGDQSFDRELDIDNDGDQVRIELTGTVPPVENYTYDPEETYTVATLTQVTGSNEDEFQNDSAHHYTEQSDEARTAIDDAEQAIAAAGGNSEAEQLRGNAISAYENANFENAIDLANQATTTAQSAQQSQQTTQTLLVVGAGVVVFLVLAVGGYLLYQRSQQDTYSKL